MCLDITCSNCLSFLDDHIYDYTVVSINNSSYEESNLSYQQVPNDYVQPVDHIVSLACSVNYMKCYYHYTNRQHQDWLILCILNRSAKTKYIILDSLYR